MKHATITIAGYTIPLIGIAESETLDQCDRCGKTFNIQSLAWMIERRGNVLLCQTCQQKKGKTVCKTQSRRRR